MEQNLTNGSLAIVTGSLGLVGAAAVRMFCSIGLSVRGIDNDQRSAFFGQEGSNSATLGSLIESCPGYRHSSLDIRDQDGVEALIRDAGPSLAVIVHAAAQPSHDWAATDPKTDFEINATATLGLLEACRKHAPNAAFIFMSTNKVYGDLPNFLPLEEGSDRLDLPKDHPLYAEGIDETMPIDRSRHSLFGVSKTSADLLVQEYSKLFGMRTVVFRAGCLTGQDHNPVKSHGFLAYLCATARAGRQYEIIGNSGKQVRDNLHADDLADAFCRVFQTSEPSGVYNIGGGRGASCSVLEALAIAEDILGRPIPRSVTKLPRYGDHAWWISDTRRFKRDYPGWAPRHSTRELIELLLAKNLS
jgi:CDP-paratose 2-epimerase